MVSKIHDSVAASMVDIPDDALVEDTECVRIISFAFANFSDQEVHILPLFPT